VSEREISPVPKEARPYQGQPAGIVTRVIANTVDALVVCVVLGAGYVGWASALFLVDPRGFEFPSVSLLFSLTAGTLVSLVYLWLSWWLAARTYGGHVMGLRVLGRHGHRLGPLRSLARAGFCVVFPVGLFWCVVSPQRRSVQDVALWTGVVYDWRPRAGEELDDVDGLSPPAGR
jgi:uncharacterized RDD family membrane protein YckC